MDVSLRLALLPFRGCSIAAWKSKTPRLDVTNRGSVLLVTRAMENVSSKSLRCYPVTYTTFGKWIILL
jgi:hypothetical protein